jgi:hypothetical protein
MHSTRVVFLMSCIALACSCAQPSAERDEIVDNLVRAGFPADDIMVVDGVVYAGGDAAVNLAASREMLQPGYTTTKEQYRTANLISGSVTKICIEGSAFTGVFSTALDLAIQNYQEQPLWFAMARTPAAGCSFTINGVIVPGLNGGRSGFPSGGLPFGTIEIGSVLSALNVNTIEHVITHEIGHTIGLRHTDFFNRSISCGSGGNEGPGEFGAIHIPGTPTGASVGASVMNSCFRQLETGELTSNDIVALKVLYAQPLHVVGATAAGGLWHTIRDIGGTWSGFGDVESQAADRGNVVAVDVASSDLEVHVSAVTSIGQLWHAIRRANGTWIGFGDVESQAGDRGSFTRVGTAAVGPDVHVCGVTSDGHLWLAIRTPNGAWQPFGDIEVGAADRGTITAVDCTGIAGELHVCAVNSVGQLWHAIRRANGTWIGFGDVESQAGDRGTITDVSCAGVDNDLHVLAVNSVGQLWHAIRLPFGSWIGFGDVVSQAGNPGPIRRVSGGGAGGELHITAVTSDGRIWDALRRRNGTFIGFGDVELQAGERGVFVAPAAIGLRAP